MKTCLTKILLASAALAIASSAQAGSILVLAPSTSKIEVIGTKKKALTTIDAPSKAALQKPVVVSEPDEPVEKTAKNKPVLIFGNTQLRTSDIELPVIQASGTKADMTVAK